MPETEPTLGQSDTSYVEERAQVVRRLRAFRDELKRLGLTEPPYFDERRSIAWNSGYETALRDLAEHPEIARLA